MSVVSMGVCRFQSLRLTSGKSAPMLIVDTTCLRGELVSRALANSTRGVESLREALVLQVRENSIKNLFLESIWVSKELEKVGQ